MGRKIMSRKPHGYHRVGLRFLRALYCGREFAFPAVVHESSYGSSPSSKALSPPERS